MSTNNVLICDNCGAENRPDAFFCSHCGIGIDLLLPPGSDTLVSVRVGSLFKAGIFGGCLGIIFTMILAQTATNIPETIEQWFGWGFSIVLSVFIWKVGPVFFGLGAALYLHWVAGRREIVSRFWLVLLGSLLGVLIAESIALWSGKLGLLSIFFFVPFLSARLGQGLLEPWWPGWKLAAWSGGLMIGSVFIFLFQRGYFERPNPNEILAFKTVPSSTGYELAFATRSGKLYGLTTDNTCRKIVEFDEKTSLGAITAYRGKLYAVLQNKGIWQIDPQSGEGIQVHETRLSIFSLSACQDRVYAASGDGFLSSNSDGTQWKLVSQSEIKETVAQKEDIFPSFVFTAFDVDMKQCDRLYAAILGLGLYMSNDGGLNIERLQLNYLVTGLECHPLESGRYWVLTPNAVYEMPSEGHRFVNCSPRVSLKKEIYYKYFDIDENGKYIAVTSPYQLFLKPVEHRKYDTWYHLPGDMKGIVVMPDGVPLAICHDSIQLGNPGKRSWQQIVGPTELEELN